ncbi:MAG TPA: DNA cytosine methyltransferase [Archaeoglobus profundus]|nr:DNA cytosine methyltransferase [Archaeoglobus profundus]
MNVVDLFAGAGGFSRGFEQAKFEVVVAVDNFKPVAETYKQNFPRTEVIVKDIQLITGEEIKRICGDVDILIGSPPCEPFTGANVKRLPRPEDRLYRDRRGQLTLHFIRLVKELKPKVFIMENVPRILELKHALVKEFRKVGYYNLYFNILKAEDYGNASKRIRVFISNVKIEPIKGKKRKVIDVIGDLPEPDGSIPNHEIILKIPKSKIEKVRKLRWGESLIKFEGADKVCTNLMRLHPYKLAPTVMGKSRFIHPFEDRFLTVREHARLMGFPDDHIFLGGKNVQYDMVGEAVPVPLAKAIAETIRKVLT